MIATAITVVHRKGFLAQHPSQSPHLGHRCQLAHSGRERERESEREREGEATEEKSVREG